MYILACGSAEVENAKTLESLTKSLTTRAKALGWFEKFGVVLASDGNFANIIRPRWLTISKIKRGKKKDEENPERLLARKDREAGRQRCKRRSKGLALAWIRACELSDHHVERASKGEQVRERYVLHSFHISALCVLRNFTLISCRR